jgi:WD40 repeat protein
MNGNYEYKVGGSLTENAPSYVVRQADFDLYNTLKSGQFCYILNSRQMGKTSLQVRTITRLKAEGIACTTIDVSGRGSQDINPEQWYAGIVYTLVANFKIANPSEFIKIWWKEHSGLSPVQRLDIFVEEFLLKNITSKIVIFIDEIDSILSLNFSSNDFFSWIRSCYEKRNHQQEYNRLTFALLGVATPSDLIADRTRTPFNIGRGIPLHGFQLQEISPLAAGLKGKTDNPQAILESVLSWTGGQPLLTQKLCELLVIYPQITGEDIDTDWVEKVVTQQIIHNWESQDEPPHLKTIKDRILMSKHRAGALLGLYQQILKVGQITADDSPEQIELRLSGLVVESEGKLKVYNRIYATVFNLNWVEKALANLRPYSETLLAWFASNYEDNSRLLRGQALEDAKKWAANQTLSEQDYLYLTASQELEKQEMATALVVHEEESRILAQANDTLNLAQKKAKHQIRIGGTVLVCSLIGAIIAGISTNIANNQLREAKEGTKLEQAGASTLQQFETKQIESLLMAMDAGQKLKEIVKDGRPLSKYPTTTPITVLQTMLDNINEYTQLTGHTDAITSINFSRDGQYVVTASVDKTARIWDISQLETQHAIGTRKRHFITLGGHTEAISNASFSPDGEYVLTASYEDKTARVWDKSGKQLTVIKHPEILNSASFSPDSKRIITVSSNPTEISPDGKKIIRKSNITYASVWDLSGNLLMKLEHQDVVNFARFSPNGKYILTASNDKTARIWDASGKLLLTLTGHKTGVNTAYWSPDSKYILTNSNHSYLWKLSGEKIATFKVDKNFFVRDADFSSDGKQILISSGDRAAIWDLTGKLLREIKNEKSLVGGVGFSSKGKRFFTENTTLERFSTSDSTIKIWDESGNLLTELKGIQRNATWSSDGKYIATAGLDRKVRIWNLSRRIPKNVRLKEIMTDTNWSPDGKYMVTSAGKYVLLWDNSGKLLARFKGHSDRVTSAVFSPDTKKIISTSIDKTARIWDLSGKQLALLAINNNDLGNLSFSADGKWILTGYNTTQLRSASGQLVATVEGKNSGWSSDGKYFITLPEKKNPILRNYAGKKIAELKGHKDVNIGTAFNPDGQSIVTTDGNIFRIWDKTGKKLSEFKASNNIYKPTFSPDGKYIMVESSENTVCLWNTSGELLVELPHSDNISSASFSPDGRRIITSSTDKYIRVWDFSGKQIAQLKSSPTEYVHKVSFSPDGKNVLIHNTDYSLNTADTLSIWRLEELDELLARGCNWLTDYLNNHPQAKDKLKVCRSQ